MCNNHPMFRSLICATLVVCISQHEIESARILAIFPIPSISHQIVYRQLTVGLSKRGHEIITFNTDPVNDPMLRNYTEIDLHDTYKILKNLEGLDDIWSLYHTFALLSEELSDNVLSTPEMQRITAPENNEHFDLILVEHFSFFALYALMERFNAPLIGIKSHPLSPRQHSMIGNPNALAYSPSIMDPATDDLGFWGRLNIAYRSLRIQYIDEFVMFPAQERALRKHFGPDVSSCANLVTEMSLILVNEYIGLGYPRPNLPIIVNIGGIAVDQTLKGLDEELKKFLDGAVNGFVYFSLGSNKLSKDLGAEKLNALVDAFAELPYRVLWKWELDVLPGKPENVYISKWLPQNDVLAHPNIKVFFYQGGLQSTEEAVHKAVPLIGCPIWYDQEFIVRKIASVRVGKHLSLDRLIYKDEIKNTIMEVAGDEGYKKRMLELRDVINDEPTKPLERAIWWTEYIIRNKGAPHLRTKARHLYWYERELLDVMLFVLLVIIIISWSIYALIRYLIRKISSTATSTVTKQKRR